MDDEAAVDVVRSPLARPPHSLENIDAVRRLAWAQQSYLEDTDFDSQQFTSNPQPVFTKRAVIGAAALGAAGLATAGIIYRKELHNFFRQGQKIARRIRRCGRCADQQTGFGHTARQYRRGQNTAHRVHQTHAPTPKTQFRDAHAHCNN
jgi:hypothetical protein